MFEGIDGFGHDVVLLLQSLEIQARSCSEELTPEFGELREGALRGARLRQL